MSRVVGIDVRANHVRVVALRVGLRSKEVQGLVEEPLSIHESLEGAVRACLKKLPSGPFDSVVGSIDGTRCFSHRLTLPANARKRLSDLLPFELEAVLPLEIDEVVFDRLLLAGPTDGADETLRLLCVAARVEEVRQHIDLLSRVTNHQPERIGCSSAELGQLPHLMPGLKQEAPLALVDFGSSSTDVCILENGTPQMVRTLMAGIDDFPDGASGCTSRLRQTLESYEVATGREVKEIVILGEGATLSGLDTYLQAELTLQVRRLPALEMEGLDKLDQARVPEFARALGTASSGVWGKGINLRQGPLAFEQGYEHLKARAPLFAALVAFVLLSFLFSVWAESRALRREQEALLTSLQDVTQSTFGQGTDDPDEAEIELEKARKLHPEDPMPYMDGYGAAVALAEQLPAELKHDVEEFELAKGKLKMRGKVESAKDAQRVAKVLAEHRCISDTKVTKITQVVNSERERYVLEAQVSCPGEGASSKAKARSKSGASK